MARALDEPSVIRSPFIPAIQPGFVIRRRRYIFVDQTVHEFAFHKEMVSFVAKGNGHHIDPCFLSSGEWFSIRAIPGQKWR